MASPAGVAAPRPRARLLASITGTPGRAPRDVPEVGFRVDHDAGRVVWTVEGEDHTKAWLPPGLVGCRYSPAQLIAEMDYAGVGVALLHTDPTLGRDAAFQRECVRAHPTRLRSMAPVDEWRIAADPDALAEEVTRAISGLGLHAVKFIPPLAYLGSEEPWDDGPYRPFWEAVAALQVPVFFTMGSGPRQLVAPQGADEAVSGYLAEQRVLMRWLERYPQIDCALTHGFPYRSFVEGTSIRLPPRVWEPFESRRLRLEVCFAVRLGDLFDYPYAPTQPVLEDMLHRIGGAERLMWGTDMPFQNRFCTYHQSRVSLEEHCGFLSDHERRQLLGGTAAAMLGLG